MKARVWFNGGIADPYQINSNHQSFRLRNALEDGAQGMVDLGGVYINLSQVTVVRFEEDAE